MSEHPRPKKRKTDSMATFIYVGDEGPEKGVEITRLSVSGNVGKVAFERDRVMSDSRTLQIQIVGNTLYVSPSEFQQSCMSVSSIAGNNVAISNTGNAVICAKRPRHSHQVHAFSSPRCTLFQKEVAFRIEKVAFIGGGKVTVPSFMLEHHTKLCVCVWDPCTVILEKCTLAYLFVNVDRCGKVACKDCVVENGVFAAIDGGHIRGIMCTEKLVACVVETGKIKCKATASCEVTESLCSSGKIRVERV